MHAHGIKNGREEKIIIHNRNRQKRGRQSSNAGKCHYETKINGDEGH